MSRVRAGSRAPRLNAGFSLAELAIVLLIVGLLLASAFIPLSTQIELRAITDTQRTMDGIREAIIGFAQATGRLPCPATGSTATGAASAGVEQLTGNACTSAVGVVPWATLGIPETDAWGRRFTYRVSPAYADLYAALTWETKTTTAPASPANQPGSPSCPPNPLPAAASFALCTLGDIAVFSPTESTRTAAPTAAVASTIPAIIVSHGKNGFGAFQSSGIQLQNPGANTNELANVTGTPTATPAGGFLSYAYYTRANSPYAGTCSDTVAGASPFCEFDDVIVWIAPSTLVARMVSAAKLP